jgi:hypothetical protein
LELDNVDSVGTLTPDACHPVCMLQRICLSNCGCGTLEKILKRCSAVILTWANGHEDRATVGQDDLDLPLSVTRRHSLRMNLTARYLDCACLGGRHGNNGKACHQSDGSREGRLNLTLIEREHDEGYSLGKGNITYFLSFVKS